MAAYPPQNVLKNENASVPHTLRRESKTKWFSKMRMGCDQLDLDPLPVRSTNRLVGGFKQPLASGWGLGVLLLRQVRWVGPQQETSCILRPSGHFYASFRSRQAPVLAGCGTCRESCAGYTPETLCQSCTFTMIPT